ncbi:hypothetical protein ACYULU_10880 [Breznakiellaceae bacterium SP9]
MKNIVLFVSLIIINYPPFLFADDTNDDFGVFINGTEELYDNARQKGNYNVIIEKEFTHPISRKKIFYKGEPSHGKGQYYIYDGENKKIILERHFRYGPWIQWYGEYLAGIFVSSANIYSLCFYDLKNNTLSKEYSFILYIDEDHNSVICAEDGCLDMYNIFTNTLIKEFKFDSPLVWDHFDEELGIDLYYNQLFHQGELSHRDKYDIQKPDKDTLIIKYELLGRAVELKGEFVYRY